MQLTEVIVTQKGGVGLSERKKAENMWTKHIEKME